MLRIFFFSLLIVSCRSFECGVKKVIRSQNLIVGGEPSYSGQWPWLVSLHFRTQNTLRYFCGSTLISQTKLISAAHCVHPTLSYDIFAMLGQFNVSDTSERNGIQRNIVERIIHKDYNESLSARKSDADIAILTLEAPVDFTDYIQPICLPNSNENVFNVDGAVAGYGRRDPSSPPSEIPFHLRMTSVDLLKCVFNHTNSHLVLSERSFCAGSSEGIACNGDSGSGFTKLLIDKWTLLGVISSAFDDQCRSTNKISFVNVPIFVDWILKKAGNDFCDCPEDSRCEIENGQPVCVFACDGGAKEFSSSQKCDKKFDCEDKADEIECPYFLNQMKMELIEKCTTAIYDENYEEAFEHFKDLKNSYDLDEIIRKSFKDHGKIENILGFIKKLRLCLHGRLAYETLLDLIENYLNDPKFSELAFNANDCTKSQILRSKIVEKKQKFINEWSKKIQSESYGEIEEFARSKSEIFEFYLPELVKSAYSNNLGNSKIILEFIRKLPSIDQKGVGYSALYSKMRSNNHLETFQFMMLVYKIKEEMEMQNYPNLPKNSKNKFETLKNNLPTFVRDFIWSDRNFCTIKSNLFDEFLYASAFDYEHRQVFTSTPGGYSDTEFRWSIQTENAGSSFTILNKEHREYLYVTLKGFHHFDSNNRRIFTWKKKEPNGFWQIIPKNGEFLLLITDGGKYFYASDIKFNENNRQVFAHESGNAQAGSGVSISC